MKPIRPTLLLILLVAGCAHTSIKTAPDSNITQASAISIRIDDKAVIVEKWLKTH